MNLSLTALVFLSVLALVIFLILLYLWGCRWFNKNIAPLIQHQENGEPPPGLYEAIKEEGGNNNLDEAEDGEWFGDYAAKTLSR